MMEIFVLDNVYNVFNRTGAVIEDYFFVIGLKLIFRHLVGVGHVGDVFTVEIDNCHPERNCDTW